MRPALFAFLLTLLLCAGFSAEEKPSCAPVPGSCDVCDSVRKRLHRDAILHVAAEVRDTLSPWYDSLVLPQRVIDQYEKALIVLYNSVPDSFPAVIARQLHIAGANVNEDDFYKGYINVVNQKHKKWIDDPLSSGDKAIDALLKQLHLVRNGNDHAAQHSTNLGYSTYLLLNAGAVDRALQRIDPHVRFYFSGLNPFDVRRVDYGSIVLKPNNSGTTVKLFLPIGPGMPPELRFPMGTWEYFVGNDCRLQHVSYRSPYKDRK